MMDIRQAQTNRSFLFQLDLQTCWSVHRHYRQTWQDFRPLVELLCVRGRQRHVECLHGELCWRYHCWWSFPDQSFAVSGPRQLSGHLAATILDNFNSIKGSWERWIGYQWWQDAFSSRHWRIPQRLLPNCRCNSASSGEKLVNGEYRTFLWHECLTLSWIILIAWRDGQ